MSDDPTRMQLTRPLGTLLAPDPQTNNSSYFAPTENAGEAMDPDRGPSLLTMNGILQLPISDKSIQKIKEWEADDYKSSPDWPGGDDSGVTIGYGYDLGQSSQKQFYRDWSEFLDPKEMQDLGAVMPYRGASAKAKIPLVSYVRIPEEAASTVLMKRTLPDVILETLSKYPGAAALPPDSLGALVSMDFNRGAGFSSKDEWKDKEFEEKRKVRDLIYAGQFNEVPYYIDKSKWIWGPKSEGGRRPMPGVFHRRIGEARLFQDGLDRQKMESVTAGLQP